MVDYAKVNAVDCAVKCASIGFDFSTLSSAGADAAVKVYTVPKGSLILGATFCAPAAAAVSSGSAGTGVQALLTGSMAEIGAPGTVGSSGTITLASVAASSSTSLASQALKPVALPAVSNTKTPILAMGDVTVKLAAAENVPTGKYFGNFTIVYADGGAASASTPGEATTSENNTGDN